MTEPMLSYRGTVYPWQCDHMGHMNVMWYVGKFDEATWNLFAEVGLTHAWLQAENRGMAAVQQNISYKRELLAGQTVAVHTAVLEVRPKLIRFRHVMTRTDNGEVAAECELTGVHLDRGARRACELPEAIRAKAAARVVAASPAA